MKKQVFHDATTGILIGLILSIIFSFIHSPSNYAPLSPNSLIGQFMTQHQVHGSLVLLYCLLIWAAIGILFSFGSRRLPHHLDDSLQKRIKEGCPYQPIIGSEKIRPKNPLTKRSGFLTYNFCFSSNKRFMACIGVIL